MCIRDRDVDHARGRHCSDRFDSGGVQTAPRRIDADDVGLEPLRVQACGGLASVGTKKFCVCNAVSLGAAARVFDGVGHDFHSDSAAGLLREHERDRSRTAVKVDDEFAAVQAGIFECTRV